MLYELLLFFILIIPIILVARYLEAIPSLVFWYYARNISNEGFASKTLDDLGLAAEYIDIPSEDAPLSALFFTSEVTSETGILMIPNWFKKEDLENNLKTAGILQTVGYNVLLPIYHWNLNDKNEFTLNKKTVSPKQYQKVISRAYDYFLNRPEIDRRNIGIWSNSFGTILACQLIKDQPIKAVVLEDGPVSLLDSISARIHEQGPFISHLMKFILFTLLIPFLWRTRWESQRVIKNIRTCPCFLIAIREDPGKKLFRTFSKLHKPRQLWLEHAIDPKDIRGTWPQEYSQLIHTFYDRFLLDIPENPPEFHSEFSIKKKKKGLWPVEMRISAVPPQLENIPLQIILSNDTHVSEFRIWFSGALATISHFIKFKPNNISVIQYTNVEPNDHPRHQWLKRDAKKALFTIIEKLFQESPEKLDKQINRYFYLKGILLNEYGRKEEAKETFRTSLSSKYWKTRITKDSDAEIIIQNELDTPLISLVDTTFLTR
ncbi:MAG: alpha/beta hydrolase family protein [Promethearchaeota archaeon]